MKKVLMILALDEQNGLGKNGDLAWRIPEDMSYFKNISVGNGKNAVIMGRKTWESIPPKYRPLPERLNIVLTREIGYQLSPEEGKVYDSLEKALELLSCESEIEHCIIIGGAQIYQYALDRGYVDELYLTRVKGDFDCDVFVDIDFTQFDKSYIGDWQESKKGAVFRFEVYNKK